MSSPPRTNAVPIVDSRLVPCATRAPSTVTAANPAADATANAMPSARAPEPSPPGPPTSRTSPAMAMPTAPMTRPAGRRRVVTASTSTRITGDAPRVTIVARLTEVSSTATK